MSGLAHPVAVACGGAIGALLRYASNQWFARHSWGGQPVATLSVNVLGCLAAGALLVWLEQRADPAFWRALLMTGVLGALTTFSALGVESWQYIRAARWDLLALMLGANLILGVAAVALGYAIAKQLLSSI